MKILKFIPLSLLLFSIGLHAQNNDLDNKETEGRLVQYKEKWKKIEGILRYRLEIYDLNNQPVFSQETENTEITIELIPGKYKKRLGLINKFNQLFLWTDWREFEIKEIPTPKIQYVEKKMIPTTKEKETLQIAVDGIIEKTKIYLVNPKNNKKIEIPFKQLETNRIELQISPQDLSSGNYNLSVYNSDKKFEEATDVIKIIPLEQSKIFNYKLLIAGVPQRENKEYLKANLIQGGILVSILVGTYAYENAIRWKDKYNLIYKQYNYINIGLPSQTSLYRSTLGITSNMVLLNKMNHHSKLFTQYRNLFFFSIIMGSGIYVYHFIDIKKYDFFIPSEGKEFGLLFRFTFD